MGDEKSLLPVSIAPYVDADTRDAIILAVSAEQRKLLIRYADFMRQDEDNHEDYYLKGYELLKELMPELTDSVWRAVTGTEVPDGRCREDPRSCCGYCSECGQHHEDAPDNEVCSMGVCHDCEHTCDGYN